MKVREVITYKEYFDDFFKKQPQKVRDKIIKVLDIIEQIDRIPTTYLKYIEGTNGLFEVRVQLGNNIFRIFCFFDGNKLVVLLSGFQKKTQKTPPEEIKRAERLMTDYYKEKEKEIGFKIRSAREKLEMTQAELASRIDKKRTFISKVENDGENITLKTLFDIVERGLGGKLNIEVQL